MRRPNSLGAKSNVFQVPSQSVELSCLWKKERSSSVLKWGRHSESELISSAKEPHFYSLSPKCYFLYYMHTCMIIPCNAIPFHSIHQHCIHPNLCKLFIYVHMFEMVSLPSAVNHHFMNKLEILQICIFLVLYRKCYKSYWFHNKSFQWY